MSSGNRETTPAASADSFHADVLEALIRGIPGCSTAEVCDLYDAVAPLVYRGTTQSPVERRWRREVLDSLQEDGRLESYETPNGRLWIPQEGDR